MDHVVFVEGRGNLMIEYTPEGASGIVILMLKLEEVRHDHVHSSEHSEGMNLKTEAFCGEDFKRGRGAVFNIAKTVWLTSCGLYGIFNSYKCTH